MTLDPLDLRSLTRPELHKRIYDLERWKAEAMEVLSGWDAVWRAAGCPGPLGAPQHENVVAHLEWYRETFQKQVDEIDRLREHSIILNRVSWRLHDAIGDIPEGATEHYGNIEEHLPAICDTLRAARQWASFAPSDGMDRFPLRDMIRDLILEWEDEGEYPFECAERILASPEMKAIARVLYDEHGEYSNLLPESVRLWVASAHE